MSDKIKIGLIYGSTREGRFCDKVAAWAAEQIAVNGQFSFEIIDPAAVAEQSTNGREDAQASLRQRIHEAEAYVVVTPEYNHGYPAPLKSLIDSFGPEWHAKPVAFVSYGGVSGGLRAVEQLRLVFAELHTVTIGNSVSFASAWEQFDGAGHLREPDRPARSMKALLRQLHWWAIALRAARHALPFASAA